MRSVLFRFSCFVFENELFFHVQFPMFRTGGLLAAGALGRSVSLLGHPGQGATGLSLVTH